MGGTANKGNSDGETDETGDGRRPPQARVGVSDRRSSAIS